MPSADLSGALAAEDDDDDEVKYGVGDDDDDDDRTRDDDDGDDLVGVEKVAADNRMLLAPMLAEEAEGDEGVEGEGERPLDLLPDALWAEMI